MAHKSVNIKCKSIGGEVYQEPRTVNFLCNQLVPIGEDIVRYFDEENCIKAVKVFTFGDGNLIYGSQDFSDRDGFFQWINSHGCQCCPEECTVYYDGCLFMYDDCILVD